MEMNRSNRSSTFHATHSGPSRSIHAFVLLVQFPPGSLGSLRPSCSVASFSDFSVQVIRIQNNSAWEDIFLLFHAIAIVIGVGTGGAGQAMA